MVVASSIFNRLHPFFPPLVLVVVALRDCLRFVSCGGIELGMMAAINVLVEAKNDVRAALLESRRRRVRGREGRRRIRTPYARQSTGAVF